MKFDGLIPNEEQRMDDWMDIHDNLNEKTDIGLKPTITISREYGCEAYPLAEELAKNLFELTGEQWNIFDHAVLEKVASNESISESFLDKLGDKSHFFDIAMSKHGNTLSQDEAYQKIISYIIKVSLIGNAIIVGRGSSIISQNFENCFHYRLVAPLDFRVSSIATRLDLGTEQAEELIKTNEADRADFLDRYFDHAIEDENLYHAIFNNEKTPIPQIAKAIEAMVKKIKT